MFKSKTIFFTLIVFILVILIWVSFLIFSPMFLPDLNTRALWGDSLGTLNTLFTGLAFAGVIVSLILQRNELELQRKELELTRKELALSAHSQEKISDSSRTQSIIHAKTARLNALSAILSYWQNQSNNTLFPGTIQNSVEDTYEKINEVYFELEELEKK